MAKVIALVNNKGGQGRTSSAVALAAYFSRKAHKCLIIDFDSQANASSHLGVLDSPKSLYGALTGNGDPPLVRISDNLHLVPANTQLSQATVELISQLDRESLLKDIVDTIRSNYDYIFIDCSPSIDILVVNALVASDDMLIPLDSHIFSMQGLQKIMEIKAQINKRLNPDLGILGVFFSRYNQHTTLCRNIYESVKETYGSLVFDTYIRQNIAVVEAQAYGKDIYSYDAQSNAAHDYASLGEEILKRYG